jgi:hypothetical protein
MGLESSLGAGDKKAVLDTRVIWKPDRNAANRSSETSGLPRSTTVRDRWGLKDKTSCKNDYVLE